MKRLFALLSLVLLLPVAASAAAPQGPTDSPAGRSPDPR